MRNTMSLVIPGICNVLNSPAQRFPIIRLREFFFHCFLRQYKSLLRIIQFCPVIVKGDHQLTGSGIINFS